MIEFFRYEVEGMAVAGESALESCIASYPGSVGDYSDLSRAALEWSTGRLLLFHGGLE